MTLSSSDPVSVDHLHTATKPDRLLSHRLGRTSSTGDPRYCAPFEQMVREGLLPGFIEIHIERDRKLKLSRI